MMCPSIPGEYVGEISRQAGANGRTVPLRENQLKDPSWDHLLPLGLLYRTLRTKKDCPECLYGLTAVRFPFGQFWTVRNTETVDHPPGVTLRSARHARGRGWLTEQLSPGSQAITKIVREADSNG